MTFLSATPKLKPVVRVECFENESEGLNISISRSRKFCSVCMRTKTYYVFEYYGQKSRRCFRCMTDFERKLFRAWY